MGNEYIDGRLRSADKAYRHMTTILALLALLCALPLALLFDSSWVSDSKLGVALTATALTALASIAADFLFAIRHARDERICEIDTFGWLLELAGWYAVRPDTPACAGGPRWPVVWSIRRPTARATRWPTWPKNSTT